MSDEFEGYDIEVLREICRMYKGQNAELLIENMRLFNAYNAAISEIYRLKAPRKIGRPIKDKTYEDYLYREANELITLSMRNGGKRKSERDAAIEANALIRKDALTLQQYNMPGSFSGLAAKYPITDEAIYSAFNRAKRRIKDGK